MQKPQLPSDETQRLRALQRLKILDTDIEERFDRITRLACRMFNVPIALVSLVDQDRQWFKSRQGLDACQTGRDISFCGHAILHDGPLVVLDATQDPRFDDNPLVVGAPFIRFYAGHPIHSPDGSRIGTICIIDRTPRKLSDADLLTLADLAAMIDREMSLLSVSTTDELTHLSNRRGLSEIGEHMLAMCRRTSATAVLIAIDLDGFKAINDTFGHAEGDTVLRKFASLLLRHFRTSDVVARLGGDEFCVLASGATEASVTASLARFATTFAESELAQSHPELSWSVGVAEFDNDVTGSLKSLIEAADGRMYNAKRAAKPRRRFA